MRPDDKRRTGGLASLSPERRREIAAMGGAAVPADKRSFSKDRALAAEAGRKAGIASGEARRATSTNTKEPNQ